MGERAALQPGRQGNHVSAGKGKGQRRRIDAEVKSHKQDAQGNKGRKDGAAFGNGCTEEEPGKEEKNVYLRRHGRGSLRQAGNDKFYIIGLLQGGEEGNGKGGETLFHG